MWLYIYIYYIYIYKTKTYRKTNNKIYSNISKEAKAIANNYEIAKKVDCLNKLGKFSKFLIEKITR